MVVLSLLIAASLAAGLQRYAVAYGYQGVSKREAWHSAWVSAVIMFVVFGTIILVKHHA